MEDFERIAIALIQEEMGTDRETAKILYSKWMNDKNSSTSLLNSRDDMERYLEDIERKNKLIEDGKKYQELFNKNLGLGMDDISAAKLALEKLQKNKQTLLANLSKADLESRIKGLKKSIEEYGRHGVDAEDYDRINAVFNTLRIIYEQEKESK